MWTGRLRAFTNTCGLLKICTHSPVISSSLHIMESSPQSKEGDSSLVCLSYYFRLKHKCLCWSGRLRTSPPFSESGSCDCGAAQQRFTAVQKQVHLVWQSHSDTGFNNDFSSMHLSFYWYFYSYTFYIALFIKSYLFYCAFREHVKFFECLCCKCASAVDTGAKSASVWSYNLSFLFSKPFSCFCVSAVSLNLTRTLKIFKEKSESYYEGKIHTLTVLFQLLQMNTNEVQLIFYL